jgi:hypothetical protein
MWRRSSSLPAEIFQAQQEFDSIDIVRKATLGTSSIGEDDGMDGSKLPSEPWSLKEADAALRRSRKRTFFDAAPWEIMGISLSIALLVLAFILAAFGRGAEPFLLVIMALMSIISVSLAIRCALLVFGAMKRLRDQFFDEITEQSSGQNEVIEGLALNGKPWLEEQRARLLHAMETQTQRGLLWAGKLMQLGVVPLVASAYLAYRMRQLPPDLGENRIEIWAAAFTLGLYAGYLLTMIHHGRLRTLLLTIEIALQRLSVRTEGERPLDTGALESPQLSPR